MRPKRSAQALGWTNYDVIGVRKQVGVILVKLSPTGFFSSLHDPIMVIIGAHDRRNPIHESGSKLAIVCSAMLRAQILDDIYLLVRERTQGFMQR